MTCWPYCSLRKHCHSVLSYSKHICLLVPLNITQVSLHEHIQNMHWPYFLPCMSSHINCLCHELHKKVSEQVDQEMNGWDIVSIPSTSVSFAQLLYHHHPWRFYLPLTINFDLHTNCYSHLIHYLVLLKSSHKSVFIRISSTTSSLRFSMQHSSKLRITDHLRIPAYTVSSFN